jgi:TPR repeat protein
MGLSKAAKGWRKGAIKGNAEDQYLLAGCYDYGKEGAKRDPVAAAAWYGKAADQDHAGAQCELGICYASGDGVQQNHELAVTFYRKAADAGYAQSQGLLGDCYAVGNGVAQDHAVAVAWWEEAATK